MSVLSLEEKGLIHSRSRVIGVPTEISKPLTQLIFNWCEGSGIEWTIRRLKDIKLDFLRKKAGLPKSSVWIKSGKDGKFFGGAFGSLETWSFRSSANFRKSIAFLNSYTVFFAKKVTPSQARKFVDGVTAHRVTPPTDIDEAIDKGIQLSGVRTVRKLADPKPLVAYSPSPSKRAPTPYGSVPESSGVIDSLMYLDSNAGVHHLLKYFKFYKPMLKGLEPEWDYLVRTYSAYGIRSNPEPVAGSLVVGRIGLIQEAGYKLRAIANPGRVFQRVLEPFGKALFRIVQTLPWDCTFDQSKADLPISARLASNGMVHSVDLSGATDYFPLDLQERVLRTLFVDQTVVDLFVEISQSEWSVPQELRDTMPSLGPTICWTKGQPLGLFPSFASFALTHGILLLGLLGRRWDGEFFVLGDDVVILDDELYYKYRDALARLGCPVSEPKTISSTKLAEFRSVIFLDDGPCFQFKWRRVSDNSFLDIVRDNPYIYSILLPRQRNVVDKISGLPSELGGLGWNPKGLPLGDRIKPFLPMILKPSEPKDRLLGYNGMVTSLIYQSKISNLSSSYSISPFRADVVGLLDQRGVDLVREILGVTFVPLYEILGRNLDMILDGDIDLPVPGSRELSKVSVLDRWESALLNLCLL